jgi:hypothetical protein
MGGDVDEDGIDEEDRPLPFDDHPGDVDDDTADPRGDEDEEEDEIGDGL